MYEAFLSYIQDYSVTPLSEADKETLTRNFTLKKYRKKQFFLQEGEVCRYHGFVLSGAMRQYSVDDKGVEHVIRLSIENWWVGDRESFAMSTPSIYNIDAWEDSEVLVAEKDRFNEMLQIPAMAEMTRKLDEKHAFALQRRVNAAISLQAEQRLEELENTYPLLLQRFPQHIIASYLGITKETLSRIRNQAAKKNQE
ncbi:cyclic nucleotide-binding domain-containing protein [bacterium]|nr:cyclic nucleotide-binding domain-containing protein [bacterium]